MKWLGFALMGYINYVTGLREVDGGGGKTLRSVMCVCGGAGLDKR